MRHIYSYGPSFAPAKNGRYKLFMRHHDSAPWTHVSTMLVTPLGVVTRYRKPVIKGAAFYKTKWMLLLVVKNWRIYFGRTKLSGRKAANPA